MAGPLAGTVLQLAVATVGAQLKFPSRIKMSYLRYPRYTQLPNVAAAVKFGRANQDCRNMNVSPYLKRRLRTLDEFLRAKGENVALLAQGDTRRRASNGAEAGDATRDRVRLTLVSSTDEPHPAR
jgi:hypothetical protein